MRQRNLLGASNCAVLYDFQRRFTLQRFYVRYRTELMPSATASRRDNYPFQAIFSLGNRATIRGFPPAHSTRISWRFSWMLAHACGMPDLSVTILTAPELTRPSSFLPNQSSALFPSAAY